jgi:hypothetical protein
LASPQHILLELFYGRWRSQTLHAGLVLGVFEIVGAAPKSADGIARELGLDPEASYRLLRALASLAVLLEHADRRFSSTPAGEMLHSAHPQSMRGAILLREGPEHTAIWKHLPDIVRDGKQDGFAREFGMAAFDYATREPAYGDAFNAGMSSQSNLQTIWTLEALDGVDMRSLAHVCDVGGGRGHLLCHLLASYPHLTGTLFDRPGVVGQGQLPWAERLGVAGRCSQLEGDMFVDVPAADAYTLKMILHDWNDDECLRILGNLRRRARPSARLFIVEHVIGGDATPQDYATLFDMHMLCWGTGRERSTDEYEQLLERSGWRFVGARFPPSGAIGVIEGALGAAP